MVICVIIQFLFFVPPPPYFAEQEAETRRRPPSHPSSRPTYKLPDPKGSLSIGERKEVESIAAMGFPSPRVGRTVKRLGTEDRTKVCINLMVSAALSLGLQVASQIALTTCSLLEVTQYIKPAVSTSLFSLVVEIDIEVNLVYRSIEVWTMLVLIIEFHTKELLRYSSVPSWKWFLECLVSECNSYSISL